MRPADLYSRVATPEYLVSDKGHFHEILQMYSSHVGKWRVSEDDILNSQCVVLINNYRLSSLVLYAKNSWIGKSIPSFPQTRNSLHTLHFILRFDCSGTIEV